MKSPYEIVHVRSMQLREGDLLAPRDFYHLISRAAVKRAFARLSKEGKLIRISWGIYVAPISSRFGRRAPTSDKVIRSLALRYQQVITSCGAQAANNLSLTLQVPVKDAFLTSGRSRVLILGNALVTIEHAPNWLIALGNTMAGDAVRALDWLGEPHAIAAVAKLRVRMPSNEWDRLKSHISILPPWMAAAIDHEDWHQASLKNSALRK